MLFLTSFLGRSTLWAVPQLQLRPPQPFEGEEWSASPSTSEPGLSERAVPDLEEVVQDKEGKEGVDAYEPTFKQYQQLERLDPHYYLRVAHLEPPVPPHVPDQSEYTTVQTYERLQGIRPVPPKTGELVSWMPRVGVAGVYDSNVELTPDHQKDDYYYTLELGNEWQVGTPDSVYISSYDTMLALHGVQQTSFDIFTKMDEHNAINNAIDMDGRIGRDTFILRPYVSASEKTGANILDIERGGRYTKQILQTGVRGQYRLTSCLKWEQDFNRQALEHPDPRFFDYEIWGTMQQLAFQIHPKFEALAYFEDRAFNPDVGDNAQEHIGGVGLRGWLSDRLFTMTRVGWGAVDNGDAARLRNLSGPRVESRVSFEWSQRLRLTCLFDRYYIINELGENDNGVINLLQLYCDFFMGTNWYIKPFLAFSTDAQENERLSWMQIQPQIEIAYHFSPHSKVFVKGEYEQSVPLNGDNKAAQRVEAWRNMWGVNLEF
ncbi:MAG: hypothetical protein V1746_04720 [bacterium]